MRKSLAFALVVLVVVAYAVFDHRAVAPGQPVEASAPQSANTSLPARGATAPLSGEITGSGTVIKLLPDDTEGDRHQRFVLLLADGRTLLVAHNIDIAPRVTGLHEGDVVDYKGEFAPNAKGGVVHWTHHDPSSRHEAGWLRHDGEMFQ